MTIKPMYERIAVKPIQEEKTKGGIIIPDTAKDKPIKGTVIAVGDGYRLENGSLSPLKVKVGDTVVYDKWSKAEIKYKDEELVIMKESDVLAVLEN